jgi:vacuolar-type H+-ATPase subunit E/Vma4
MTLWGSVEAVIVAVQEDAGAEIEKIDRDVDAAMARARAEDAALPAVIPDAEARIAAARHSVRDRTAAEDGADRESALTGREEWIRRVREAGERRLAGLTDAARRADLTAFAVDAIGFMPDEPIEVLVPLRDGGMSDMLRTELATRSTGRTIAAVRAVAEVRSGCVAQTIDGRIRYENTYDRRAERFEPIWRAFLADQYERSTQPTSVGAAGGR